ncbi:AAA family ATPase [Nonomuraea sp. NBC_01738]|uniref:AAA family ATPase n=1 Tax=Nonomuraea sp. NBC_01738 TaxID=2976003 RepID=UPI002E129793
MRPHRLTLTAFGSFPGTETIPFDDLTEAGLFLVHGPTGAGKTTILDALCFALFGKVANAQRDSARSLRCDHAPPGTGPSVVLEVTLRGRLFRIERSPVWQRPKLRGTGFTEEKTKVVVAERAGDGWQGLTTRADEAGDLVGGLLGMNADQFCQVAMLPQGDFARFLRSDGDDRRKLLERLFTVKVFTQAESWLAEHRVATGREAAELRRRVDYAVQRIEEAAGEVVAEEGLPPVDDEPLAWADTLLGRAGSLVETAGAAHEEAGRSLRSARARYEEAAALAERRRRHAEALTLRRTLDERAEERAELQAILDDAARADRVLPLINAARQRAEAVAKARSLAADARARAHRLIPAEPPRPLPAWLATGERERRAEIARLQELLTEEARLLVIRRDLERAESELTALAADDETTASLLAGLPARLTRAEASLAESRLDAARVPAAESLRAAAADLLETDAALARLSAEIATLAARQEASVPALAGLTTRRTEARDALAALRTEAATLPAARTAEEAAGRVLESARRRDTLTTQIQTAEAALHGLVERAQAQREHWLDLRQARLDGMAAELARDLRDGDPCAVCGSPDHPRPASPAATAPSADDERAAQADHERAQAARDDAERALLTLRASLATAAEAAGGLTTSAAGEAVTVAAGEVARLRALADGEPALAAEAERLDGALGRADDLARRIGDDLTAGRTRHDQLSTERDRLLRRVGDSAGDFAGEVGEGGVGGLWEAAEREVHRLRESAGREETLAAEAGRLNGERASLETRARHITARLAAGRTRQEELSGDAGRLTARLDAARGDDTTLAGRLSRLSDEADLLLEVLEATQVAAATQAEHEAAAGAALTAAREAGFADPADARAAARPEDERERKAELLRDLDAQHAAVTSTLNDPDLIAAAGQEPPTCPAWKPPARRRSMSTRRCRRPATARRPGCGGWRSCGPSWPEASRRGGRRRNGTGWPRTWRRWCWARRRTTSGG